MPRALLLLASVAIMLLGAGCHSASPPRRPVQLVYLLWGDVQEEGIVRRQIEAFEATHPDIGVQMIVTQDFYSKLNTMMAGGTAPDVFYVDAGDFPLFQAKGVLLDVQPLVERDAAALQIDDFYPILLDAFRTRGRLYALPKDFSTYVMYYNKTLFDDTKTPYPPDHWTWRSFLEVARQTSLAKGPRGFRQYGFLGTYGFETLAAFIFQNGGRILSEDRKTCLLDQPEAYEAIQFVADLKNKYGASPTALDPMDSPVGLEVGGSAMDMAGRWMVPRLRDVTKFTWDVAPLPAGKTQATLLVTVAYGISKQCAHPEAAWELVKYLTSRDGQRLSTELGLAIPSRRSVAQSGAFCDPRLPPAHYQVYLDGIAYARLMPYCLQWNRVRDMITAALDPVMRGEMTAKDACRALAPEVDKLLREEP